LFGGSDQVAASEIHGRSEALFVAAEDDANLSFVECAGFLHGAERGEHDDQAAFHVGDAGTGGDFAAAVGDDRIFLETARRLEDGVHVADEKETLAALPFSLRAWVFGDEIAGARSLSLHRDPAHLEAESFESRDENILYRFDAGQVHGAAVDIHNLLEQGLIGGVVCVDGSCHLLL